MIESAFAVVYNQLVYFVEQVVVYEMGVPPFAFPHIFLGFNFGFSIIIPPSDHRVMRLSCGYGCIFSCCILVQGFPKNNRSCVNGSKSCVNSYLQSLTPFFLADIITMEWATPKKAFSLRRRCPRKGADVVGDFGTKSHRRSRSLILSPDGNVTFASKSNTPHQSASLTASPQGEAFAPEPSP